MKTQIKQLRLQCDALAQLCKELKPEKLKSCYDACNTVVFEQRPNINSKEIEKAADNLYLAKAWAGKLLQELGEENPYGSGYKTVEDIVPTQDVNTLIESNTGKPILEDPKWIEKSHIEKVDWLRNEIEKLINEVKGYFSFKQAEKLDRETLTREMSIARTNTYNYLCEAKFELGFELGRIRDLEK